MPYINICHAVIGSCLKVHFPYNYKNDVNYERFKMSWKETYKGTSPIDKLNLDEYYDTCFL